MEDYSGYKNILGMFVFLTVIAVVLVIYFYRNIKYSRFDEKAARKMSK
jgi:ABC-type Mn2+/Zn2+ transport system permease subunit